MNSCKFNVAFCLDSNYQAHFGAAVMSLLLNYRGKPTDLCVHVVIDNPDERFIKNVEILKNTFAATIKIYPISEINIPQFNALPLNSFYTRATYLYYLLPYLISPEIKTILVLDSDLVVLGDVQEVFLTDLSDYALAGVSDFIENYMCSLMSVKDYVNSGVILINLDYWRKERVAAVCMEFAAQHSDLLLYLDQCALNFMLSGRIKKLDPLWNVMVTPGVMSNDHSLSKIIHYITKDKPWHEGYDKPLSEFYKSYAKISPWGAVV